jgi:hypothetical protein
MLYDTRVSHRLGVTRFERQALNAPAVPGQASTEADRLPRPRIASPWSLNWSWVSVVTTSMLRALIPRERPTPHHYPPRRRSFIEDAAMQREMFRL